VEFRQTNWWFRKWCDPVGEHTETSGVDPKKRPYPIDGTWERYTFKVGNIRFLMMSDRNDLPYPVGRRATSGASPAGAVMPETFEWWKSQVERAGKDEIIITGAHHMLRETTVGFGDYEGVSRNPDGTFRSGKYHGPDGAPEGASYLYFLGDQPKAQAFDNYLAAHPGAIDLWVGGHTHTHPDDVLKGRSHVERKWGVNFVNCAQLCVPQDMRADVWAQPGSGYRVFEYLLDRGNRVEIALEGKGFSLPFPALQMRQEIVRAISARTERTGFREPPTKQEIRAPQ
jgi:hypothetical protein